MEHDENIWRHNDLNGEKYQSVENGRHGDMHEDNIEE
jgi:hypothetical protein